MTDETKNEENVEKTEQNGKGGAGAPAMTKPVILGRKVGMLQHFKSDGTVIAAEPNLVTYVRTRERDGYSAVQIGFGRVKDEELTKPERGHLKASAPVKHLREVRLDSTDGFAPGQEIGVDRFAPGDRVHVTGISKGKGFIGPVHLHHFHTGPRSHGSDHYRRQGSVGAGTTPGRVVKGQRMAGHMGHERVSVLNLSVVEADPERNLLLVRGAIPGPNGGLVMIRTAVKGKVTG